MSLRKEREKEKRNEKWEKKKKKEENNKIILQGFLRGPQGIEGGPDSFRGRAGPLENKKFLKPQSYFMNILLNWKILVTLSK